MSLKRCTIILDSFAWTDNILQDTLFAYKYILMLKLKQRYFHDNMQDYS